MSETKIEVVDDHNWPIVEINQDGIVVNKPGPTAGIFVGGPRDPNTTQRFCLNKHSNLVLGGAGGGGSIHLVPPDGFGGVLGMLAETIRLDGNNGNVTLLRAGGSKRKTINLDGGTGTITLTSGDKQRIALRADSADMLIGGDEQDGAIFVYPKEVTEIGDLNQANIVLSAEKDGGKMALRTGQTAKKSTIVLDAKSAAVLVGGNEQHGAIFLYPEHVTNTEDVGKANIELSAKTGDIVLKNADCAEEFDIVQSEEIVPGTLMVLDREGKLEQSTEAYDKKVAGVISGAGGYRPAIILDKQRSQSRRMPVALVGKVYCKADAEYSPIEVGDLLTSSSTPGHAMKATDSLRAFGAVIGKALRPLSKGRDLIPILIALQ